MNDKEVICIRPELWIEITKALKALEILKRAYNSEVFYLLKIGDLYDGDTVEYSIEDYESFKIMNISQQEYDLLKEVLEK